MLSTISGWCLCSGAGLIGCGPWSRTHIRPKGPAGLPEDLAALTVVLDRMAARDLERLSQAARAERVMVLGPMVERLVGQWLKELAGVDARGAAGAEQGVQFGATAGWLRAGLRMSRQAAATAVRTARALFRGPLPASGAALCAGELSVAHAEVLAAGTKDLADHVAADAEATLLEAARRLDLPGYARWSLTSSTRSTRTGLMPRPNGAMPAGGVGDSHL